MTFLVFIILVLLPAIEVISRLFSSTGIVASSVLVQHLTLWVGFLGAVIASRRNNLLSLTTKPIFSSTEPIEWKNLVGKITSIIIVLLLAYGSWLLVQVEIDFPVKIAPFISRWFALLIMPLGFLTIAYFMFFNSFKTWKQKIVVSIIIVLIFLLFIYVEPIQESNIFMWIAILVLGLSLYVGAPIFIGLGGVAILFFWRDFTP
ncbi:MAG: TRAP transporter small permease subunit, partial [Candidatus Marinimicrobia bacterium]|nr:TRAP transporter small permease subunit [Candidatus Neomarinimicrobiota bacterium]